MKVKFEDTKLRKNKNEICHDIFINCYDDKFTLVIVRNGQIITKKVISREEANEIVEDNDLEYLRDEFFKNAGTFRIKKSNKIIRNLLEKVEQ